MNELSQPFDSSTEKLAKCTHRVHIICFMYMQLILKPNVEGKQKIPFANL